ncbi:MAG: protease modulator HflC [Planctomycetota bacterium]|jgi:membrane protease subunit HflC
MIRKLLLILAVLAAVALYKSVLFVDETEMVIVTQFGRPVKAYHLADCRFKPDFPWVEARLEAAAHQDAGLHFKLPYQSAIRIDRRLQIYDPRPSEFLAKEKKNVDLDVFVCWRVADPQQFLETVNDFEGAKERIHDIVWSELAAEVGRNEREALVSVDPTIQRLDELMAAVSGRCAERARLAYGIQVVDVRLKRISLPEQVRESVFNRMRAERARIAGQYRAEGEEKSLEIRAEVDKQATIILTDAVAEAKKIAGEAEAEAARIYTQAHQKDPELYDLLRHLEAYEKFLDEKTTLLISADSDLLKYLTRGVSRPSDAQ